MPGGDEASQASYSSTMGEKKKARENPFYSLGRVGGNIAALRKTSAYMKPGQRAQALRGTVSAQRRGTSAIKGGGRVAGTGIRGEHGGRRLVGSASNRIMATSMRSARATMTGGQVKRAAGGLNAAARRGSVPAWARRAS